MDVKDKYLNNMTSEYFNSNSELIIEIHNRYDEIPWDELLANFNTAILIGSSRGHAVDRYNTLPKITMRSKHTVMSWFQREGKKLPLIDLCYVSNYLKINLFTFFARNNKKEINKKWLLDMDCYCSKIFPKDSASIYIEAYTKRNDTDKSIILDNISKYFGSTNELILHHSNKRQQTIMEICGCSQDAYYSWFNRSRKNVRIPMTSLCKIAIAAGVDVFDLMTEE